jgi:hypothetical protein
MAERYKIITSRHTIADLATTTLTQLSTVVDFDAWKSLYTNGSSVLTELSLGAQYTVFQSGGATSAPSWGLITNNNVAASGAANIAWDKLAASTVNAALRTGATGYPEVVPVNATASNKFLRQVSSGAPSFEALSASDIPALSYAPSWSGLTVGSILYASAATTVGEIAAVTAGRFLVSNGTATVPYYPAGADLFWDEGNNRLGIGTSAPSTRLHLYSEDATTNNVLDVLTIDRGVTGGVGSTGIGSGIVMRLENGKVGGGVMTEVARLETVMTTVTDGAEYSEINFKRRYNGSMETLLSIGSEGYRNSAVCICPTSGPGELAFTHDSWVSLVQEDVTGNLFLWAEESAAGVMTYWDRVNDYIGILTDAPDYPLDVAGDGRFLVADAATNTVATALRLQHTSSSTPTSSFGVGTSYVLEDDDSNDIEVARIDALWDDGTHDYPYKTQIRFQIQNDLVPIGMLTRAYIDYEGTHAVNTDLGSTSIGYPLHALHTTSDGSATDGIGSGMTFDAETESGSIESTGAIAGYALDATTSTVDGSVVVKTAVNSSLTSVAEFNAYGAYFNNKVMLTPEGGIAIKLTWYHSSGTATVKGTVVRAKTLSDNTVETCAGQDERRIGVLYDAGVASGSETWVVVYGRCQVLADASGFTRGNYVQQSSTNGRAADYGGTAPGGTYGLGFALTTAAGNALGYIMLVGGDVF